MFLCMIPNTLQVKMIKLGGRKIRLPGRKIRIRVKVNFKVPLLKHWDWRRYVRGYKYECKWYVSFHLNGGLERQSVTQRVTVGISLSGSMSIKGSHFKWVKYYYGYCGLNHVYTAYEYSPFKLLRLLHVFDCWRALLVQSVKDELSVKRSLG